MKKLKRWKESSKLNRDLDEIGLDSDYAFIFNMVKEKQAQSKSQALQRWYNQFVPIFKSYNMNDHNAKYKIQNKCYAECEICFIPQCTNEAYIFDFQNTEEGDFHIVDTNKKPSVDRLYEDPRSSNRITALNLHLCLDHLPDILGGAKENWGWFLTERKKYRMAWYNYKRTENHLEHLRRRELNRKRLTLLSDPEYQSRLAEITKFLNQYKAEYGTISQLLQLEKKNYKRYSRELEESKKDVQDFQIMEKISNKIKKRKIEPETTKEDLRGQTALISREDYDKIEKMKQEGKEVRAEIVPSGLKKVGKQKKFQKPLTKIGKQKKFRKPSKKISKRDINPFSKPQLPPRPSRLNKKEFRLVQKKQRIPRPIFKKSSSFKPVKLPYSHSELQQMKKGNVLLLKNKFGAHGDGGEFEVSDERWKEQEEEKENSKYENLFHEMKRIGIKVNLKKLNNYNYFGSLISQAIRKIQLKHNLDIKPWEKEWLRKMKRIIGTGQSDFCKESIEIIHNYAKQHRGKLEKLLAKKTNNSTIQELYQEKEKVPLTKKQQKRKEKDDEQQGDLIQDIKNIDIEKFEYVMEDISSLVRKLNSHELVNMMSRTSAEEIRENILWYFQNTQLSHLKEIVRDNKNWKTENYQKIKELGKTLKTLGRMIKENNKELSRQKRDYKKNVINPTLKALDMELVERNFVELGKKRIETDCLLYLTGEKKSPSIHEKIKRGLQHKAKKIAGRTSFYKSGLLMSALLLAYIMISDKEEEQKEMKKIKDGLVEEVKSEYTDSQLGQVFDNEIVVPFYINNENPFVCTKRTVQVHLVEYQKSYSNGYQHDIKSEGQDYIVTLPNKVLNMNYLKKINTEFYLGMTDILFCKTITDENNVKKTFAILESPYDSGYQNLVDIVEKISPDTTLIDIYISLCIDHVKLSYKNFESCADPEIECDDNYFPPEGLIKVFVFLLYFNHNTMIEEPRDEMLEFIHTLIKGFMQWIGELFLKGFYIENLYADNFYIAFPELHENEGAKPFSETYMFSHRITKHDFVTSSVAEINNYEEFSSDESDKEHYILYNVGKHQFVNSPFARWFLGKSNSEKNAKYAFVNALLISNGYSFLTMEMMGL